MFHIFKQKTGLRLFWQGGAVACLLVASGCVDQRYDLTGDLDWTIGVGGQELAIPIGQTERITLEKLIGAKDDELKVMPDGTYALYKEDSLYFDVKGVDPISVTVAPCALADIRPSFSESQLELINRVIASGGTIPVSELPVVPISSTGTMTSSEKIPSEVKQIDRLTFRNEVPLRLSFAISGTGGAISRMRFENLKLTFPDYVQLASGGHELIVNQEFEVEEGTVIDAGVVALHFDPALQTDGAIHLEDEVRIAGNLRITGLGTATGDFGPVVLKPLLTIGTMEVQIVEGRIEPDLPQVSELLLLDDMPEFLREDGIVLDVNPYIDLTTSNPLGVSMDLAVGLLPIIDNTPNDAGRSDIQFQIPGTEVSGTSQVAHFRVASVETGLPEGYTFVGAENLPALVRTIPDAVQIGVVPSMVPDRRQVFDLSIPSYRMDMKYALCVPMSFGPQLSILYRDTVDNLLEDIGDFVDKVHEVKVEATVDNTVPIELQASAVAVDRNMQPLSGVEVSAPEVIAPGKGNEPVVSSFDVVIRETQAGALAQLDGLILEIRAGNTEETSGIAATPQQYVQVRMTLRVPGGLTADLDNI